jgi:hypothetical protein
LTFYEMSVRYSEEVINMKKSPLIPRTRQDAASTLNHLLNLDPRAMRALGKEQFLRAWNALFFLLPGLHPDNVEDNGKETEDMAAISGLPVLDQLLARSYVRSGWPVVLEPFGRVALLRHDAGEIGDDELYCVEAQRAGLLDCSAY